MPVSQNSEEAEVANMPVTQDAEGMKVPRVGIINDAHDTQAKGMMRNVTPSHLMAAPKYIVHPTVVRSAPVILPVRVVLETGPHISLEDVMCYPQLTRSRSSRRPTLQLGGWQWEAASLAT